MGNQRRSNGIRQHVGKKVLVVELPRDSQDLNGARGVLKEKTLGTNQGYFVEGLQIVVDNVRGPYTDVDPDGRAIIYVNNCSQGGGV